MKINPVRFKLVLLIFITLIPLSILNIIDIRKDLEINMQAELEANQEYAEVINTLFMNFLERTWSNQYVIGKALISQPNQRIQCLSKYLNDTSLENQLFKMNYYWATPEGIMDISSKEEELLIDIKDRSIYQEIINGKEKVIGNLERSTISGELIIPIARGILVDGELKGIVINTIKANDIKHILPINRIVAGSIFGLVDKDANIVYRSGDSILIPKIEVASEDSPTRKALRGEIIKTYSRYSQSDGIERLGVDCPIKEIGWVSFVATPVEKVLANGRYSSIRNLTVFTLIYIISFAIAILMSSNFIQSIEKLKLAAHKVKTGDLNVKTGINEEDVFGDVGQAFDKMVEALNQKAIETEEYNQLKSNFLATISHEFKTPLNIILGSIQLLENTDMNDLEEFKRLFNKYIGIQKQNSYRLLRLISNFIDITKIESSNVKIKLRNNDIVKVIEDITMSIVEYTKMKDISIIFDTDVEEKIIAFDMDMMERIMLNLLSNAIKFTEKGGEIQVNIYVEEEKVIISVKDNGIGIPQDKLEMIFDRFAQVENPLRRGVEGSGIGLSLVKSLVELHEGSISVHSELGKGSEFIMELPDRVIDDNSMEGYREEGCYSEKIHVEFSDIYVVK
ncbi:HAMP domain-containing protein [Tissierella praeacuta DSM 18095]|uniref:histidine kinase n=1 Tax=Tissierella praeacuta DSM 18095 TaxID=1123404 RepID=A0A1M4VK26_9FIRM|nr:sensor histidine kinase [Tissierella praeacuta]TCU79284.1 HAMP domain-containing protein [Tissierella praeacuta]SHE69406.1 HAMP domain-containing protein [Tissierella praeacuta DSM 18095]SUO99098.1 Sensor kinase protein RcsC [Tissierella praeacuta]